MVGDIEGFQRDNQGPERMTDTMISLQRIETMMRLCV